MRTRFQSGANSGQIFRRRAEPSHAGVYFQMNGVLRNSESGGGPFQQFYLTGFPNRRRKAQPNNFFFFASPEPGHQQDSCAEALLAKWNRLIEGSDAQPGRALFFQG